MTGWPVASLCQMAAVRARMRCRIRTVTPSTVRPPCRSRSSWPLRVSLTDSMACRNGLRYWRPAGSGSPLRGGRGQGEAAGGEGGLEVVAVVVLVADDDLPGPAVEQGAVGEDGRQDLPLV